MKFVIWVPSCHLKVFIAETTKIPCLYNHVHFMKALVLRAMFLWPVTSDGLWDGDSVYEADLVCIQSQRSWRADGEPLTPWWTPDTYSSIWCFQQSPRQQKRISRMGTPNLRSLCLHEEPLIWRVMKKRCFADSELYYSSLHKSYHQCRNTVCTFLNKYLWLKMGWSFSCEWWVRLCVPVLLFFLNSILFEAKSHYFSTS